MAIIYSYPKTTPVASDLLIISRVPSDPNETATYSVSIDDLAGLISGTGTVTTFSATSSIPGITTTVTNSTTTPNLALSITGTPASGTYLDHAGNFTTPPGSGSVGTLSQVLTQGNTTGGSNIVVSSTDNIQASGTNANLKVQGNGTGKLEVRSADTVTPGAIQLNCEQNSHGVSLQSPAHSAGATYTLKLPTTVGTNTQVLQTDGNDPAQLSWAANSGSTNLSNTAYSTNVFLASSTGTDTTIAAATTSLAGVLTAADKTKLDGIQTAADTYDLNAGTKVGINVPLNLTSGSGSDNSLVTLTEGSGVTLTRNSATQITIASSGGGGGATDINGLSDASTQGTDNVSLGTTNVGAQDNTIVGIGAYPGGGNGSGNVAVGKGAGAFNIGTNNVAVGYEALEAQVPASQSSFTANIAIGFRAAQGLTGSSESNIAIGSSCLPVGGASPLNPAPSLQGNVCIGKFAGNDLILGDYNVMLGQSANAYSNNVNGDTSSTNCISIGHAARSRGSGTVNQVIRIGSGTVVDNTIANGEVIIGGVSPSFFSTPTIRPAENNATDLGKSTHKYKDIYYDGILQSGTLNIAPASATATGTTGEIRFTADHIYVCVATNTWKRTAISTF